MRLSANLSWLYPEMPWAQRFATAANDGFGAVEILLPYEHDPQWYVQQLRANGLELSLLNTPIGPDQGRLGWAAVPNAGREFAQAFDQARAVANATGCRRIHVMAGDVAHHSESNWQTTLLRNLDHALRLAETDDLTLCLEALNRADMAGYAYWQPSQVIAILQNFDTPRLRLQFDYYHCVKEGLDLQTEVRACAPWIDYVQIAGAPSRAEPDLSRHHLLEAIVTQAALGYDGWLGCEYRPRTTAAQGLVWCEPLRSKGVLHSAKN